MSKKHEHKQFTARLHQQLTLAHRMIEELKNANHAMSLHIQDLQDEVSTGNQAINELAGIICEMDFMIMHQNGAVISHFIHTYREHKLGVAQ